MTKWWVIFNLIIFFNIDYHNGIITNYVPIALQERILDVAELQFPSIAWEAKSET